MAGNVEDQTATLADPPGSPPLATASPPTGSATRSSGSSTGTSDRGRGNGTSVVTPRQAMMLFEARRAWVFAMGLVGMCAVAIAIVVLIGGDPLSARIHIAGLAMLMVPASLYAVFVRDPSSYRPWKLTVIAYVSLITNASGYFYWGVFSGYGSVVTLSAYSFISGGGKRSTAGMLVMSMVLNGGLGFAQLQGWIGVHSLVVPAGMSWGAQLLLLIVLQGILVGAVLLGGDAYRTMERVINEHHGAVRELAQREAQLAEAHAEVRDALAPGEGRHTGATLGQYRLGRMLGRGAMGEVYDATDVNGMPCAVKVLAFHLHDNEDALRRFHREARAIAGLDAPNVVRMIEVSPVGSVVPFLAMERLQGRDLGAMLKDRPTFPLAEVVPLVRSIADGLDAAHAAGVVHRDLKPPNVFAAEFGAGVVWKVLDFGVAKLSRADATMTAGQIVGTPGYMAPEQARGGDLDGRADVYALGVIAYRLLTGRPAVVPGEAMAMLHEVVFRMPPAPSQLVKMPAEVEAVLAIALAKNPDDRFVTAGELAAALAAAAAGRLDPALLERSKVLVARAPWGRWLRSSDARATTSRSRATRVKQESDRDPSDR